MATVINVVMEKSARNKAFMAEIQSRGRKYVRALHTDFGFDFEKPFDIFRIDGSFTLGSVKKLLSEQGYSAHKCVDAILLNHDEWGVDTSLLHVARLTWDWDDFCIEVKGSGFSHFSSKSDFNKSRKCVRTFYTYSSSPYTRGGYRSEEHYDGGVTYVVVQHNEFTYKTKQKPTRLYDRLESNRYHAPDTAVIDSNIRYKVLRNSHRSYDIAPLSDTRSVADYYSSGDEYAFDKSGYCVSARRYQLKEAAQALRDKRAHDAFSSIDTTAFIIAIDAAVATAKQSLSCMFNSADSYADYKAFREAFNGWHGFYETIEEVDEFKRDIANKDFKDMAECTAYFNRIIANLGKCAN